MTHDVEPVEFWISIFLEIVSTQEYIRVELSSMVSAVCGVLDKKKKN